MTTITDRILKFKPMIQRAIAANHTFFIVITFGRINSLVYINFIVKNTIYKTHLSKTNFHQIQKDYHQDNLSFACVIFYSCNCLNILVGNIYLHKQVMNQ